MKILTRYLFSQLVITFLYVLLAFVSLYALFDFLDNSAKIGRADFTAGVLFHYVLWRIPIYCHDVFPVAVLIGSLITLSRLSSLSEYAIMRTSGVSIKKLITLLLGFALICATANIIISEFWAPKAYQQAEILRYRALHGKNITLEQDGGLWFKSADEMVRIGGMLPDNSIQNITRYQIAPEYRALEKISESQIAHYQNNEQWQLLNTVSTQFEENTIHVEKHPQLLWKSSISPDLIRVLLIEPQQMSVMSLHSYINHLGENNQKNTRYKIFFWRKIFYPFGSLAMILIALAFTPVIARHSNMGWRIFLGICLGIAFHFAGRFFSFYAELFHLPPFLAGSLPVLSFVLLAGAITYISQRKT